MQALAHKRQNMYPERQTEGAGEGRGKGGLEAEP